MVVITNGVKTFKVTQGAYDGIYSHQGYKIVEAEGTTDVVPEAPQKTNDEIFLEEIVEKPISQWNKDEVKRFASLKEIDITGTKNANEAKEIIKAFLEQ